MNSYMNIYVSIYIYTYIYIHIYIYISWDSGRRDSVSFLDVEGSMGRPGGSSSTQHRLGVPRSTQERAGAHNNQQSVLFNLILIW